ncbi:MAG TPA: hypothetical protein VJY34_26775, partial [Roseiarcus sp.]|nr:hypothetical protein [Roseiarcus sp.]
MDADDAPQGVNFARRNTAIRAEIEERRPNLLVLDTLADLFGGDEIKRPHARQFISLLRGLAIEFSL